MTAPSIQEIADKLSEAQRRATLAMTDEWQFCGRATFTAGGAHSLHWARIRLGRAALAERERRKDGKWSRDAYRLTPLGLEVRDYLLSKGEA